MMDHTHNETDEEEKRIISSCSGNHFDMPRKHLVGLERSLPSLNHLFAEYRGIIEEKVHYEFELEHETQIADDLQNELDYLQKALDHKTRNNEHQLNQVRVQQQLVSSIEAMHKELKGAVKALEEQLKSQQEGTRIAIETAEKSYHQIAQADEKEFQLKLNELEADYKTEMENVREDIKKKNKVLNAAREKAEFEYLQRKEELRKTLANRMKATSHHIECRSVELDLKKQIVRLEKEVKILEQQRSKRKLPLTFAGGSPIKSLPFKSPNPKANKSPLPFVTQQVVPSIPEPQNANNHGVSRKRKLFSVNSDFLDF